MPGIFNKIYFNFFSVSCISLIAFSLLLSIFFLSLPKKSKATLHFGISFAYLTIFYSAYLFSYSIYHPVTAFHRWFTVPSILLAAFHFNLFIVNYPSDGYRRLTKILIIYSYLATIIATVLFCSKTINAPILYSFDGNNFDFDAEKINKLISLIISQNVIISIGIVTWRMIKDKKNRWWLLIIILIYQITAGSPSITNTLSRDGLIEKNIHQVFMFLIHIIGFFLICLIFINNTKNRTTFLAKIVGISLLSILVVLHELSFFTTIDQEEAYDKIHRSETRLAIETNDRPADIDYIISYSINKDKIYPVYLRNRISIDVYSNKNEFLNTAINERIKELSDANFDNNLKRLLDNSHEYFAGYKNMIIQLSHTILPGEKNRCIKISDYINDLKRNILYQYNKIKMLSNDDFRISLKKYLKSANPKLKYFNDAVLVQLNNTKLEGKELKDYILKFHSPMKAEGVRNYRHDTNNQTHYTAFMKVDLKSNIIFEVGYSYSAYKEFIHPLSKKLIIMITIIYIFVIAGFPLFFSGTLIKPLKNLLGGVGKVMNGDLNFNVPVKVEDEIGFLSRSFNNMVQTIKSANKKLNDYANNLEKKVEERTSELKSAMEEMESMNDELIKTRDQLWGEMQLAKKIQTVLLPRNPTIDGFEISTYMLPASEVGGDYYDIINIGNRSWVVIGDVSGHGVPAGLVMMMVQTSIHVALKQNPYVPPSELLALINDTIAQNIRHLGEEKYMTITVLATHKDGKFYFSGLHQDMMIYRAKTGMIERIETDGMWIGLFENIEEMLEDNFFILDHQDTLLLYTDGLTEAMDSNRKLFSMERLGKVFLGSAEKSVDDIKYDIIKSLETYTCNDDVTIVVLKRI